MNDLIESDKKNIWHPFTPLVGTADPILITSAKGVYLTTHDGKKIIDAISSWYVNLHGHAHPYIAKAVAHQAKKLEHVIFAGFTHEPAIQLSKNLLTILPKNQAKIFFSDNGSTAVEVALKMALQYWHNKGVQKTKIVAFHGAYHGDTFGSMSVGERGIFSEPFSSQLFEVEFIDFPLAPEEEKTLEQFKKIIDTERVAAFIFEPLIQAVSGMRVYSSKCLDKLIDYAHSKKVICIADEVFTGFGRTGKLFACDYLANKPDIIALSKGLTGGTMPLGVTCCSKEVASAFETDDFLKTFFHGHSYTGNPLACAAANASYDLLMHSICHNNILRISKKHSAFKSKIESHIALKEVRTLGTILALELKVDDDRNRYSHTIRKKIYSFFIGRDILIRPLGNVFYVLPPYVIKNTELDRIYNTIKEFLDSLHHGSD